MRFIALTGGIACGKSTVESFFQSLSIPVLDADQTAKSLTEPGTLYYDQIIQYFGIEYCTSSGALDRARIARRIFQDPIAKTWLEKLLHQPILSRLLQKALALRDTPTAPYCIISIPLLAETGKPDWIDATITVICPPQIQLQRLLQRNPTLSLTEAKRQIAAQTNNNVRLKLANYTLHNDGTLADLKQQVYHLHNGLIQSF